MRKIKKTNNNNKKLLLLSVHLIVGKDIRREHASVLQKLPMSKTVIKTENTTAKYTMQQSGSVDPNQ